MNGRVQLPSFINLNSSMRNQAFNSNQSSLDNSHSITIPENYELSGSAFSTPPNTSHGHSGRPPISTLSSPSVSISSLSSIGASPFQPPRHFRRSQTGGQLLVSFAVRKNCNHTKFLEQSRSIMVTIRNSSSKFGLINFIVDLYNQFHCRSYTH
jgi:hypothetical protein